jgi:hypothetical protein
MEMRDGTVRGEPAEHRANRAEHRGGKMTRATGLILPALIYPEEATTAPGTAPALPRE